MRLFDRSSPCRDPSRSQVENVTNHKHVGYAVRCTLYTARQKERHRGTRNQTGGVIRPRGLTSCQARSHQIVLASSPYPVPIPACTLNYGMMCVCVCVRFLTGVAVASAFFERLRALTVIHRTHRWVAVLLPLVPSCPPPRLHPLSHLFPRLSPLCRIPTFSTLTTWCV